MFEWFLLIFSTVMMLYGLIDWIKEEDDER